MSGTGPIAFGYVANHLHVLLSAGKLGNRVLQRISIKFVCIGLDAFFTYTCHQLKDLLSRALK